MSKFLRFAGHCLFFRGRIISQEVNKIVGPGYDGLYNFVEVVFMKDDNNILVHEYCREYLKPLCLANKMKD